MADFDFSKSDIELLKEFLTYPNDFRYPVGTILISDDNEFYPEEEYGGEWKLLPEGYALWTASSGAGDKIAAGLPNITGQTAKVLQTWEDYSGALYSSEYTSQHGATGNNLYHARINIDASKGETKLDGTFSNDVYGKSDTVQPPAYKVKVWKKTKTEKEKLEEYV